MIEIKRETEKDISIIQVRGDVDASSSIHLDNAINEALKEGKEGIIVDCHDLDYISSA
ncbi:STAS domain-containing protein, partial [Xanthovirga aplysinae]|uniref:STAS domain-containing protein n=1 Tax=Xanthovirga aplysinae TaxID=2529853 RepID=UPI001656E11F|nr:anti-sigma factor antagonist [Xanthovirga aplysinae]